MATKRFDNLAPERKDAFLLAARRAFIEKGFEGTSLNDILKAAGMSKGQFYYYFEDKADLFATVIAEAFTPYISILDTVGNVQTAGEYWRELEEYYLKTAESLSNEPEIVKLGFGFVQILNSGNPPRAIVELVSAYRSKSAMLVEKGRRAGAVTTDMPDDLVLDLLNNIGQTLDNWSFAHMKTVSVLDITMHTKLSMELFKCIAGLRIP